MRHFIQKRHHDVPPEFVEFKRWHDVTGVNGYPVGRGTLTREEANEKCLKYHNANDGIDYRVVERTDQPVLTLLRSATAVTLTP